MEKRKENLQQPPQHYEGAAIEAILKRLRVARLANGSGKLMLALLRLGRARFKTLQKEERLTSANLSHNLKPLVEQGLVCQVEVNRRIYYEITKLGKTIIYGDFNT